MIKKKQKDKAPLVLPSLMKPDAEPEEITAKEVSAVEEQDLIQEEDDFETPPSEPAKPGEGP